MQSEKCTYVTSFSKKYYDAIARHTLHTWKLINGPKLFVVDNFPTFKFHDAKIIDGDSIYPRDKYYAMQVGKCQKFWRKGRAFTHALLNSNTRYVAWIDSDVKINKEFDIEEFLPSQGQIATVIVNDSKQIESGFVVIDTDYIKLTSFIDEYQSAWYNGVLETLYRPWDGDVLNHVLKDKYKFRNLRTKFIKKPQGFEHTILENYMHHYSGKRQKHLVKT